MSLLNSPFGARQESDTLQIDLMENNTYINLLCANFPDEALNW